jgi:hypothetical protein
LHHGIITEALAALGASLVDFRAQAASLAVQRRVAQHEIGARLANIGASVLESNVSEQDVSQELRNYPSDLLQSPLKINSASFRVSTQAGGNGGASAAPQAAGQTVQTGVGPLRTTDRFADLITMPALGPGALLLTMLAAFGWGALVGLGITLQALLQTGVLALG